MPLTEARILSLNGPELKLVHAAVIESYDPESLEQDLFFELDRKLDVTSAPGNFNKVAFQMLDRANREGWLRDLLTMFRQSKYFAVKEVADRMLGGPVSVPGASAASKSSDASLSTPSSDPNAAAGHSEISTIADPYLCYLIGQQPFIDRSALRVHLKDLLSESTSRVLVVTGDRPCGKSYTWFFISQPELLAGITPCS